MPLKPFPRRSPLALAPAHALMLALATALPAAPLYAQQPPQQVRKHYTLGAGSLEDVLTRYTAAAGIALSFDPALVAGLRSPGLNGSYSGPEGLHELLHGSGLAADARGDGSYTLRKLPPRAAAETTLAAVKVTAAAGPGAGALPEAYAGGQIARGGRVGMLGNQDVFDTPFAMSSYTAELIENQQARTVADVIVNDASTRLMNPSQGTGETFSIRGFNTGGNGAELYDGLAGLTHRRRSTVENMERVEVFKGANALLTGTTGSVGGAINLVPKRPADGPVTRLTTSYELPSRASVHADISRRFGPAEQFGIRFNGLYRDGEATFENNKEELGTGSLALDYRGAGIRLSAVFDHEEQTRDGGSQQFSTSASPRAPDTKDAIQQPWEENNSRFSRGLLRAEYDLNDAWMLQAAYGASAFRGSWLRTIGSNLTQNGNFTQVAQQQSDDYQASTINAGLQGRFQTAAVSHKLVVEATTSSTESGRLSANIAGYSVTSNLYDPVRTARPSYVPITKNPPKTAESTNESLAIADTLGLWDDRVLLTVGVRNQRVKSKNFSATTGAITSRYDESAVTPALGVAFRASATLSLYGNYIESLEAGPTAPSSAANAGEVFAPSKTKQVELGAKLDFGRFGLTTAIFEIERPSGLTDASNYYNMDGRQRNRGLELSLFGEALPELRLLGGLTYIDSEMMKTQNGQYDGKTAVGVPRLSAVLGFEWDVPYVDKLTLTGRANHTGRQYIANDNSGTIPAYTLYGIGARYKTTVRGQALTLRANIDNLFDKDYWTTFAGSPGILYLGSPRRTSISVSLDL